MKKSGPEFSGLGPEISGLGPDFAGQGFGTCDFIKKRHCEHMISSYMPQHLSVKMPLDLVSRVFSSATLLQGVDMLERSVGMDPLNASDAELEKQLQELEEREPPGSVICKTLLLLGGFHIDQITLLLQGKSLLIK